MQDSPTGRRQSSGSQPASLRSPHDPQSKPSLEEVALRAGVSRSAASRALNNAPHVSPLKREAVLRAAQELGYVPNATARALATNKVGSVVLVVSNEEPAFFADPFFSQIIVGITTALEKSDLVLTLMLASPGDGSGRLKRLLGSRSADGVMVLAMRKDDPLHEVVESTDLPLVFCGRTLGRESRWYVDADNRGGARLATEHLLSAGRRRIASIVGPMDSEASVARYKGFADAMAVVGLPSDWTEEADFTPDGGARAMTALLEKHPDLDGVFVGSDNMAAAAMRVLKAHGRSVPEDVVVAGFDDLAIAQQTEPSLTTVSQPIRALGQEMALMLMRLIEGENPSPIILPTHLVVRESAPAVEPGS
ncbi:LacI family DNA-binding transcriptional regulator [Zhihengliuella halotolerans]|uniref:LacI family DNA-binding transcriptional regulator n=1 Tax=Zhihengliuella halotolerans TaxID=370736 RepID=UPI000C803F89|nr:LacI family DNA-binding transcriptional regulator [Zhihengliuella halotolerans]